jgi:hypothetical protein
MHTAAGARRGRSALTRAGVVAVLVALVTSLTLAPTAVADTRAAADLPGAASAAAIVDGSAVETANLANFQPGNIISDAVFANRSSMTEAQIQSFLQSKLSSCASGYTCLKDYYDTSRTTSADAMCGAYSGGVRERASRIIYKVAQACGINPQVILVMLQKEQGLVTASSPSSYAYRAAMGQGCPDTAACDTRYYGFFNQVYGGAWQLKRYANPPGTSQYFTWYAPGKTWNVLFHPNSACGSSPVYIQNQATANLYYYTPYQPNAAAKAAGYGTGDSCSSYGNRNFYNYFTDWFGSTQSISVASIEQVSSVFAIDASDELWVYPRRGVSSWYPRVSLAKGMSDIDQLVGVGDLDGDGFRDILGVGPGGEAWLYQGTTGVALESRLALPVDWADAVIVAAAHDFDHDGIPDVIVKTEAGALELWRGNGSGSFRAPLVIGSGWGGIDAVLGVGDLSGDGRADIVARAADGRLILYSGDGHGRIARASVIGTGWSGMASIIDAGDIDRDGRADLLALDSTGGLWGYVSTGSGLRSQGRVGAGWAAFSDIAGAGPVSPGARVFQPGAGDVDADGNRDVLASTATGALLAYRGNGKGGWAGTMQSLQLPDTTGRTVTLGDFTGDGVVDLARISASGQLTLMTGNDDGTFTIGATIGNGWTGMSLVTGGIDFDGDRRVDIVARDAGGDLRLYRGNGAGGFQPGTGTVVGAKWTGIATLVNAGDFTGDRAADLIAVTSTGQLMVYPTDGEGSWLPARQSGNGWGSMTAVFSPGDFDRSGGTDLVGRSADGRLILYRGDGRGGFSGTTVIGTGWSALTWIG